MDEIERSLRVRLSTVRERETLENMVFSLERLMLHSDVSPTQFIRENKKIWHQGLCRTHMDHGWGKLAKNAITSEVRRDQWVCSVGVLSILHCTQIMPNTRHEHVQCAPIIPLIRPIGTLHKISADNG